MRTNTLPVIALVSEASAISVNLSEKLLVKNLNIKVFCREDSLWIKKSDKFIGSLNFKIHSLENLPQQEFDYLIFVSSAFGKVINTTSAHFELERIRLIKDVLPNDKRVFVVAPFAANKDTNNLTKKFISAFSDNESLGVFLVGDLLGPKVDLAGGNYIARSLSSAFTSGAVEAPKKEAHLYPTSINESSEEIVNNLFSFGPYSGERVLIRGRKITVSSFLAKLSSQFPNLTFKYSSGLLDRKELSYSKKHIVKMGVTALLEQTLAQEKTTRLVSRVEVSQEDIGKLSVTQTDEPIIEEPPEKIIKPRNYKKYMLAAIVFIFLLLLPLLSLFAGASTLAVSAKLAKSNNLFWGKNFLYASRLVSNVSMSQWRFLSKAPLGQSYFEQGYRVSKVLSDGSSIGIRAVNIIPKAVEAIDYTLSPDTRNLSVDIESLALEIDLINKELNFIQSEIDQIDGVLGETIASYLSDSDFENIRRYTLAADDLVGEFEDIFGSRENKTYLVLFQNNMELRPTGGFIGSLALVTFSDAKLLNFRVLDVYSVDGQIKGYVAPPDPITDHLGEATWYLRDSNWDADFEGSAKKAQWFLDKALDEEVDGVIAVDLGFAKELLAQLGPIYLSDFNKVIDQSNFYEVTQSEVEDDFFPGSRKKANILTALTREVFAETTSDNDLDYYALSKVLLNSLETKHVLISLNNQKAQDALSVLGWNGEVVIAPCSGNCYSDYVGMIEANVGVNKANYHLSRSATFDAFIDGTVVKRQLNVYLKNNSSDSYSSDEYKAYLRVITPKDVSFGKVQITNLSGKDYVTADIVDLENTKEAGVLIKIPANESATVRFTWESESKIDFTKKGEYNFFWRKQPGTDQDRVVARLVFPAGIKTTSVPTASLTQGAVLGYNTNLLSDFSSKVTW